LAHLQRCRYPQRNGLSGDPKMNMTILFKFPSSQRRGMINILLIITCLCIAPALLAAQGLNPASLVKPLSDSWPTYSGDYSGRRYSSLTHINQSNVKNLSLAWSRRFTNGANPTIIGGEGTGDIVAAGATQIKGAVLQVDGVLYVTTPD